MKKSVMSYILGSMLIVVVMFAIFGFCDRMDRYEKEGTVTYWCPEYMEIELSNGQCYEWEFDSVEEAEAVGSAGGRYIVTMKDYENGNPYDDAIVSFKSK